MLITVASCVATLAAQPLHRVRIWVHPFIPTPDQHSRVSVHEAIPSTPCERNLPISQPRVDQNLPISKPRVDRNLPISEPRVEPEQVAAPAVPEDPPAPGSSSGVPVPAVPKGRRVSRRGLECQLCPVRAYVGMLMWDESSGHEAPRSPCGREDAMKDEHSTKDSCGEAVQADTAQGDGTWNVLGSCFMAAVSGGIAALCVQRMFRRYQTDLAQFLGRPAGYFFGYVIYFPLWGLRGSHLGMFLRGL